MKRILSPEISKKAAATTVALIGMTGLAGCGDILGGSDSPKTIPETRVYNDEAKIIQPALIKLGGQTIAFWKQLKGHELARKDDAYELKQGENDYFLTIDTNRGGRHYAIDVELRTPDDPNSVYDVSVESATDPSDEFGIVFDLSTKPWAASATNYYTDFKKVNGKTKKKMQTYGDSTDNYSPGIKEIDGYDGFLESDADQALKVATQTVRAAEHAANKALQGEK